MLSFMLMQCQHTAMKKHKVAGENEFSQASLTIAFHLLHSSFSHVSLKFVSWKGVLNNSPKTRWCCSVNFTASQEIISFVASQLLVIYSKYMLHWFSRDERWKLTFEGTVPLKKLLSYVYKASLVVDTDHHFLKLIDVTKCDEILSLVLHLCSRLQTKFKINWPYQMRD